MSDDTQEKPHAPSEQKWREAAEQGQLAKSQDVSSAAVLLAGGMALIFASNVTSPSMRRLIHYCFDIQGVRSIEYSDVSALAIEASRTMAISILIPLGVVFVAAIIAGAAQTQLQMATKAMTLKWERIDPFANFKQHYLSATPLVELVKSLLKLGAIGMATLWALYDQIHILPTLTALTTPKLLEAMMDLSLSMLIWAIPVIIVIAALDYSYAYYQVYQQVKRTDQEVKEENKQQHGDPQMRSKRKQIAREMANARSLALLPQADVIITNPTHYAVALRYQRGVDQTPVVVAKGVDDLAMTIRREAYRLDIPRIENRPIARSLFAKAKVGKPIPEELFGPVAQVLAVVYRKRAERKARLAGVR